MGDFNGNPFWPVWYRLLQTALEAAPTLLCGLVVAGLIRGFLTPAWLRRCFTTDFRTGPVRACFIGFLLPVCSFGVLPVAWELRRAGVPRATVVTFLLSAPLTNPISLISTLQKLGLNGVFAVGAYVGLLLVAFGIVAGLGILMGRLVPEPPVAPQEIPGPPAESARRLLVFGLTPAYALTGMLAPLLILGLLGSGLLALVPGGAMERAANDRTLMAPLHMALVALPVQLPPEKGSTLACDMLLAGNRLGVVFVFLLLGVGASLATPAWVAVVYGWRCALLVAVALVGTALAVGLAVPLRLPNVPTEDLPANRFLEVEISGGADLARTRALEDTLIDEQGQRQWLQIGACAALGLLVLIGIACRVIGEAASPDYQMKQQPLASVTNTPTTWNAPVSSGQLLVAGMLLGLAVVLGGLYVVYPAPATALGEMSSVQVELNLLLKKNPPSKTQARNLVDQMLRMQGKLTFGDFLRRGRLNSPLRQPSEDLRASLQKLRTALATETNPEELASLYAETRKSADRCRQAVGPGTTP